MDPKRLIGAAVTVLVCGCAAAWAALAQIAPGAAAPSAPRAVATVAGRRIDAGDFEQRVRAGLERYASRGTALTADAVRQLRRQVLEGAIRGELMALEARRTGALVPVADAEEVMKRDPFFSPGGRFDEPRWFTIKNTQKERFQSSLAQVRDQLSAQRLTEQLLVRSIPPEAQLRAEATRQLARVGISHFSLRRGDFAGTFPEPREQAVYDRYRNNRSWYARPARVTMSVVFVNTPGLMGEDRKDAVRSREWAARMRRSADSMLTALRGGADLEDLAAPHGGVRPKVVATLDDLPGFWKGDAATRAALFAAERGSVLPQPVEGTEGYLVIRVDERSEAHVASLAEAAREIRGQLRDDLKRNHVDYEMRDLYAKMRDSLASDAWRVRWAFADPQQVRIVEPSAREIETYYRSRLADYSTFDAAQGRIVATPLADVREDVLQRLTQERRIQAARTQADRLYRSWTASRREGALERELTMTESPPTPRGVALDATSVGAALADSLWRRGPAVKVGLVAVAGGFAVYDVFQSLQGHVPSFEQAQARVKREFDAEWSQREERGARALFDREPARFGGGEILHFRRASVTPPEAIDVPLTRPEVEAWYRKNLEKFSAPELMRAKHILITPAGKGDAADRLARQTAEGLLARARGGEDFSKLAREHSQDEPTKSNGGDLGTFGRGVMLQGFEQAAFELRPGQISDLVRTEAGYHIIQCLEYEPAVMQPLDLVYINIASDLAMVRAESLAVLRADSLLRAHRTPAGLSRALTQFGFETTAYTHRIGDPINSTNARPFFQSLEQLKAGQIMRPAFRLRGQGAWLAWIDSVSAPRTPTWEEAKPRALEAYRVGGGARAVAAKQAELDSLLAAGWSADTLADLWGGAAVIADLQPGRGITGLGSSAALDSFVFGDARHPAASVGASSGWIELRNGVTRVTVLGAQPPPAAEVAARLEMLRGEAIEQALREHFSRLETRYPIRILDPELRATELPTPRAIGESRGRR